MIIILKAHIWRNFMHFKKKSIMHALIIQRGSFSSQGKCKKGVKC